MYKVQQKFYLKMKDTNTDDVTVLFAGIMDGPEDQSSRAR